MDLHHLPQGTHSLAPRPGSLVRLTFLKGSRNLVDVGRVDFPSLASQFPHIGTFASRKAKHSQGCSICYSALTTSGTKRRACLVNPSARIWASQMLRMTEKAPPMKTPVPDSAVDKYVDRIRAGGPLGDVFPCKMSECDFTPIQREKIKKARAEKRAALKHSKVSVNPLQTQLNWKVSRLPASTIPQALNKLRKILYLQNGNCFFCGMPLAEGQASVEHLNPKSRGGTSTEDNEVVCHKTLNEAFGNMDLRRKFEFVIRTKGALRCPGT